MKALVVYDSQFGNTEQIAHAIAEVVATVVDVQVMHVNEVRPSELEAVGLVIVGSPTQGWKPTKAIQSFFNGEASKHFGRMAAACFDTRFRKARWLTGSAARSMAKALKRKGVSLLVPPESFFVQGSEGPLYEGELDRATLWGWAVVNGLKTPQAG